MTRVRRATRGALSGPLLAILIGVVAGLLLLLLSRFESALFGPRIDRTGRIEVLVNGVGPRMARDLLLPTHGWTLQVRYPGIDAATAKGGLEVRLRSERTGATLPIHSRFEIGDDGATFVVPESLGLGEGLVSVRARLDPGEGPILEDRRRLRIRGWLGGPPIGARQVVVFDFSVDRDDDGVVDFVEDLEHFGLAVRERPDLATGVAARVEARALARVERAYAATHDPNRTGRPEDPVRVRFRASADPADTVTRICVGGSNPTIDGSVGYVRFDRGNERRFSTECGGEPHAGIFPAELDTYQSSALYREVLGPFLPALGGRPFGSQEGDRMDALDDPSSSRVAAAARAVAILGDVLGTVMAHEAGHALGLVAPGKPGVGLFGGAEGDDYAHNLDPTGGPAEERWLMNPGKGFRFEELAGLGEGGELVFRPLSYAYLRDRVVLVEGR